jgi:hypothetical protein
MGSLLHTFISEVAYSVTRLDTIAVSLIEKHDKSSPLFLYLSYSAPHDPVLAKEEDLAECAHISHYLRREFCGMVVGIDKYVLLHSEMLIQAV